MYTYIYIYIYLFIYIYIYIYIYICVCVCVIKAFEEEGVVSLIRVHVPKWYMLWPQSSPYTGTLGPKYVLFGHMDP